MKKFKEFIKKSLVIDEPIHFKMNNNKLHESSDDSVNDHNSDALHKATASTHNR
jgi:hypothetical protein